MPKIYPSKANHKEYQKFDLLKFDQSKFFKQKDFYRVQNTPFTFQTKKTLSS